MKQNITQIALSKIQENKRKAENAFEEKMKSLYQDKKYAELYKKYTKIVIENAKKSIFNEKIDDLTQKDLEKQILDIKKSYKLDGVEIEYACPLCKDEGYKDGQMCKCLKRQISKELLKNSGFEKLENFESAMKTCGDLLPVYKLMQAWCKSDFKKTLIYLAGGTGVGKTYLMRCMANEFIEQGKVIKIVTAFEMNQDFKEFSKCFDDEILNKYLSPEILFVDDLGTEPLYKNVSIEYLYLVINERKMKKLPTIITGNLDLEKIRDRYDERIFSRIVDKTSSINLLLDGEDKRLKKRC